MEKPDRPGTPLIMTIAAALLLACAHAPAMAQDAEPVPEISYGEAEFLNSCAVCHGISGKGDGPLAEELKRQPTDLTRLRERNHGVFPFFRVYAVIDGRFIVPGHGERDMPVWGREFLQEDTEIFGAEDGEVVTNARIHQLAAYIDSLQR